MAELKWVLEGEESSGPPWPEYGNLGLLISTRSPTIELEIMESRLLEDVTSFELLFQICRDKSSPMLPSN